MLTNFFIRMGWSRDDLKWPILQIVSVAGLIASNTLDLPYWAAYLGIPLSTTALHWILTVAAIISWLAGTNRSSRLPSANAMASGTVVGSPVANRIVPMILIALLMGGAVGCAGTMTPLRQVQVTHDALATAQDIEAQLCWGVATVYLGPSDRSHCTTPVATLIGLTAERHQAINAKLKIAFDLHRSITAQIAAGAIVDLSSLETAIFDILALVAQLQQTPAVAQLASTIKAGEIR